MAAGRMAVRYVVCYAVELDGSGLGGQHAAVGKVAAPHTMTGSALSGHGGGGRRVVGRWLMAKDRAGTLAVVGRALRLTRAQLTHTRVRSPRRKKLVYLSPKPRPP